MQWLISSKTFLRLARKKGEINNKKKWNINEEETRQTTSGSSWEAIYFFFFAGLHFYVRRYRSKGGNNNKACQKKNQSEEMFWKALRNVLENNKKTIYNLEDALTHPWLPSLIAFIHMMHKRLLFSTTFKNIEGRSQEGNPNATLDGERLPSKKSDSSTPDVDVVNVI